MRVDSASFLAEYPRTEVALPKRSASPLNTEPSIRFPVTCPKCRQESLTTLPLGFVAAALISGRPIRLHASCHDVYWDAQDREIEQIREYVATPSLHALQASGDIGPPDPTANSPLGRRGYPPSRPRYKAFR
jgi:hypothetical protein